MGWQSLHGGADADDESYPRMTEIDAELLAVIHGRVGQTVCAGKYSIEGVLGIGGMAAVYAGVHRNGRRVAMKLLHPQLSRRADIRKRFLREGQAANKVDHRGVVAVIDDDVSEDGSAFIVMERLEGKTLEQLWEDAGRRLPVRVVLAIGRELCEVLAVAHRMGIVHRDLKPENLFLTNEGQLKVLDFGLAHLRDAARPKDTHTGMVFGTPAFMPPEQAGGQTSQIDARTDVWAVGATMFTLLSGELVHLGETGQQLVILSATQPARSLRAVMPDAHPILVDVIDRALAHERERRWQSADAMREAIIGASETIVGDAEISMMTPTAIAERSSASTLKRTYEAGPPRGAEGTTKRGGIPAIGETLDESSSEKTQVRTPEAFASEPLDAPTEPRGRPALGTASSDTPTEQRTPSTLIETTLDWATPESDDTQLDQTQRASWRDLLGAGGPLRGDDNAPAREHLARADVEPISDETALIATQYRPSSRKVLQAAEPDVARAPSLTRGQRVNPPALLPLTVNASTASTPARSSPRVLYVSVVLAAALLGSLPLIYFVARGSRAAVMAESSSTTDVPSTMGGASSQPSASIVAPPEKENVVRPSTSAAPSTVAERPTDSTVIVPDNPYKPPAPRLPTNPYASDAAAYPKPAMSAGQPNRRSNCSPPYVVDANGKLHWKEECLTNSKSPAREDRVPSERQ